jgi:hypothetical protein
LCWRDPAGRAHRRGRPESDQVDVNEWARHIVRVRGVEPSSFAPCAVYHTGPVRRLPRGSPLRHRGVEADHRDHAVALACAFWSVFVAARAPRAARWLYGERRRRVRARVRVLGAVPQGAGPFGTPISTLFNPD